MRTILLMMFLAQAATSEVAEEKQKVARWNFCHVPARAILAKFVEYDLSIAREGDRVELTLQRLETVKRTLTRNGKRMVVAVEELKIYGSQAFELGQESIKWRPNKVLTLDLSSETEGDCQILVIRLKSPPTPTTTASGTS